MTIICIVLVSLLVSFILTGLIRRFALSNQIIDIPNERSSHQRPTPRGGGLSFVLVFLISNFLFFCLGFLDFKLFIGICLPGSIVAFIGFIDDRAHVPALLRLFLHFLAALIGVYFIGGLPSITFMGMTLDFGDFANILAVIYLVWILNLYNFMDGIDGIASLEAITVLVGGGVLLFISGEYSFLSTIALLVGSIFGFLLWNFPSAKIFMGDAGSGFLGITLGIFSIYMIQFNEDLFWAWLILLAVFIVDSTFTLLRRTINRQAFYKAHRSHAYQYASRLYGSHKKVSLLVVLINVFYLFPLSILVTLNVLNEFIALVVAYSPLLVLAMYLKAGDAKSQGNLA